MNWGGEGDKEEKMDKKKWIKTSNPKLKIENCRNKSKKKRKKKKRKKEEENEK